MKLDMKDKIDADLVVDIKALIRVSWSKFVPMAQRLQYFKEAMYGHTSSMYLKVMLQKEIEVVQNDIKSTAEFNSVKTKFESFGIEGKYITNRCSTFKFVSSNFVILLVDEFFETTIEFNDDTLNQFVEKIKQFFDGKGEFITKVQVVNFSMDIELLNLNSNFRVRKINSLEKAVGEVRSGFKSHRYLFNYETSCFVVEQIEKYDIEINDEGTVSSSTLKYDRDMFTKNVENFILCCRLFHKSDVFLDNEYISEFFTPAFSGGRSIYHTLNGYELKLEDLKIMGDQREKFKNLFESISLDTRFKVSTNRLSLSMERKNLADRLIDLVIGLEAFYKTSGSVHICLRPSFLLSSGDRTKAKEMYSFIDTQRELRNKVVHGSGEGLELLNKNDLDKLEEILRSSLQFTLLENNQIPTNKEWYSIYF